ncbi:MAG: DUF6172 family protein [Akkermansiaceae bacterium]|jgi:hypothetical protein
MKKNFPLVSERHKPARLGDQIKGEVRKYLKRERSKKLPEGVDYWDFACRSGKTADEATKVHEREIGKFLDAALEAGWESIYLEILVKEGHRGTPGSKA